MGPEWLSEIFEWIRVHPGAAGLTIAVVAFLEGLALVGILIPGIIILFGFGALVGLGVLDLPTVWFWCSLGAICGDGVSFWLGYHFKDHLRDIWPFSRYRQLLARGEAFFRRHGLKSIVIGRFIGPIRPVMPVVAGMMGMAVKRYVPANIAAGFLWAPAYLLPGVVFGASIELAKAVAFRLALVICLLVGIIWILTWLVMECYHYLAPRASRLLAFALRWSHRHPVLGAFTRPLVDPRRPESGTLALFALLVVVAGSALVSLLITVLITDLAQRVDAATLAAFTQLRTPWADRMMAIINGLGTATVLLPSAAGVLVWLLWRRRSLAAWHWAGAVAVGFVLALTLGFLLQWFRGEPLDYAPELLHVAMGVVVYGFFAILVARELPARRRVWPYLVASALVAAIGTARLYFGADGPTDLLAGVLLGVLWVTIIGIAYRRRMRRSFWTAPVAAVFFLLVLGCTTWYAVGPARAFVESRAPLRLTESIDHERWWSQGWEPEPSTLLRVDTLPINVQYAGPIDRLTSALFDAGWAEPPRARWATALEMLQPHPSPATLPVLPSGWRGRSEALILHWYEPDSDRQTVLHLWPADVLVDGQPLWAGMLVEHHLESLLYFFSYWGFDAPKPEDLDRLVRDLPRFVARRDGDRLLLSPPQSSD